MCVEVTVEELGEGGSKERPVEVVLGEADQTFAVRASKSPRGWAGLGSGMAGSLGSALGPPSFLSSGPLWLGDPISWLAGHSPGLCC